MKGLESMLIEHPFFDGMAEAQVALLAGCATNVRFAAGNYVFREGDPANTFYCIRTGLVALEIHSPGIGAIRIDTITMGDILGWSWVVAPYQWYCDARVLEPVRAFAVDGACLRGKCDEDPVFGYAMLKRFLPLMYRSLQATQLQLMDVYGNG